MQQTSEIKEKLEAYLKARFPRRKELSVAELERASLGASYITYYLTVTWQKAQVPVSESMVIRMQPEIGCVPPYDIRPQYEVLEQLHETGIPVPKVYWLEMDSRVLGYPFFTMEKVEGEVLMTLYNREPDLHDQLKKEFVDYLVKLHELDWQALGLSILGVPENDCQHAEKELERWEWIIEQNQYNPQPVLAEALIWLTKNIPRAERTTLCHGDYYAHNLFCRGGHIVGIFDWELADIGDPISDIGYTAALMDIVRLFWNETEFIKAYEEAAGVKVNEESFFFWKLLGLYQVAAIALAAIRVGRESEGREHLLRTFSRQLPVVLDLVAKMLKI